MMYRLIDELNKSDTIIGDRWPIFNINRDIEDTYFFLIKEFVEDEVFGAVAFVISESLNA